MAETKSSNKDVLTLDYYASKNIASCFLRDLMNDLKNDNEQIKADIDAKDAFSAQVEDYTYNVKIIENIHNILIYLGEEE